MREDFITTPKNKVKLSVYLNVKTVIGIILFLLAIWLLAWSKLFTPLVIYLGGFSFAILGLAFLLSGAHQYEKKKQEKLQSRKIVLP